MLYGGALQLMSCLKHFSIVGIFILDSNKNSRFNFFFRDIKNDFDKAKFLEILTIERNFFFSLLGTLNLLKLNRMDHICDNCNKDNFERETGSMLCFLTPLSLLFLDY